MQFYCGIKVHMTYLITKNYVASKTTVYFIRILINITKQF